MLVLRKSNKDLLWCTYMLKTLKLLACVSVKRARKTAHSGDIIITRRHIWSRDALVRSRRRHSNSWRAARRSNGGVTWPIVHVWSPATTRVDGWSSRCRCRRSNRFSDAWRRDCTYRGRVSARARQSNSCNTSTSQEVVLVLQQLVHYSSSDDDMVEQRSRARR